MKQDVLNYAKGYHSKKIVSKETLNHRQLVQLVSGLNPFTHTKEAFLRTYDALGIDIINRVPLDNAPVPCDTGMICKLADRPYTKQHLGIFDSVLCNKYMCDSIEELSTFDADSLNYDYLVTPVPHSCHEADIRQREAALGETGCYYPMLYTTLFMWPVETLGWELFMEDAILNGDKFHDNFLVPCAQKSIAIIENMANSSTTPFIFLHDDLATATGPVFPPDWYESYIFPHYPEIFAPIKKAGKKVILVADGNMTHFLPRLIELGVDGIMFESPATPLENIIEYFGKANKFFIGGMETNLLTFGSPKQIYDKVITLHEQCQKYPKWALASGGGLHDSIPLENLIAYFDARAEIGATPKDWKSRGKK